MKKLLLALGVLVVLVVALVFALPLFFSSDSLRALLARELSDATGAEIAFEGPVSFSVFPNFGIVADDLAYTSGDGALSV